ncbi:MAG TPA: CYCXC family (seleno)protein [Candidatus Binataceae bacterium]|nr:CYCXC family (seleno)protein [Candidatus Binataceae bacterium]
MKKRWRNHLGTAIAVVALLAVALGAGYRLHSLSDDAAAAVTTPDPALFKGDTRRAYEIARDHPELLMQLHCYCGCEQQDGHRNLFDCYRTNHASSCEICIGETLLAARLADQGMPVEQIRAALRQRYDH